MNVKRFSAQTARKALGLVKQAFGDDAVVLSTRPCSEGVEVLAMAGDGVQQLERVAAEAPAPGRTAAPAPTLPVMRRPPVPPARGQEPPAEPTPSSVDDDVGQLAMSTLSFQDYVRERMLRRRRAEQQAEAQVPTEPAAEPEPRVLPTGLLSERAEGLRAPAAAPVAPAAPQPATPAASAPPADTRAMLDELRAMRGLIEDRFGALAFIDKLQRQPRQRRLTQKLLDQGFSPALIRKLADQLPSDGDELGWAAGELERQLHCAEHEGALEEAGGVYALVGPTGVGKTTSTAKLAAAFATRHGAAELGLITLDAYRIAAHEQLRAYGRILGVPVHTAHDRASLNDLLDLLSAKRMVLIDTAGMAQRDARTRELLEMVSHRSVKRLLVVNAAAQADTLEDVLQAYRAGSCHGVVLSKVDEAVKLGPALDAMIRHKLKVLAVANGQRVPEDWHRLSAQALLQQALRATASGAWRMDAAEVSLVFAGLRGADAAELRA